MTDETPGAAEAAEATAEVLETPAPEDAGAQTQDRYLWQHRCTAAEGVHLVADPDFIQIVCEHHEDYVVVYQDRKEIVSCKHRDANRGPWNLTDLCADGGVAHLFSRWSAMPTVIPKLMTNAALKGGSCEAGEVVQSCDYLRGDCETDSDVGGCAAALARALLAAGRRKRISGIPASEKPKRGQKTEVPEEFLGLVKSFMAVLYVRHELPSRDHAEGHFLVEVVHPALDRLGIPTEAARLVYRKIVGAVGDKNVSGALTGRYGDWLFNTRSGLARGSVRAIVQARTISRIDIEAALRGGNASQKRTGAGTSQSDVLRAKMRDGGVKETRVSGATRLRESWLRAWSLYRTGLPGDEAELEELETSILQIAGDVEARVAHEDGKWGNEMYVGLRDSLEASTMALPSARTFRNEQLLGAALELSSRCEIWFSERFDVHASLNHAASSGPDSISGGAQ